MKKLIIILLVFCIGLTSCHKHDFYLTISDSSDYELYRCRNCEETSKKYFEKKDLLSEGVLKLSKSIVDDYYKYYNGEIYKNDFINNFKLKSEQINNIADQNNTFDDLLCKYLGEINYILNENNSNFTFEYQIKDIENLVNGSIPENQEYYENYIFNSKLKISLGIPSFEQEEVDENDITLSYI